MIILRYKTFARADYEGLDDIAREQLAKMRSQIAKDLLKKRAKNYQTFVSDLAKPDPFESAPELAKAKLNGDNLIARDIASDQAEVARVAAKCDMLNRRRSAVLAKRARAKATKRKIIGGVALGAAGLAAGAGYLYNKKKKSQENQESASK